VLLPLSALFFSLLALELSATIKKCTEEGYLAFMSPRIQSSQQQVLSERLEKLLEMKDVENLKTLLVETRIIRGTEQNLTDLETLELSIAKDFEDYYNRILHYLPDDLKEFFEASKILWDVENLKLLLCCILEETPPDKYVQMMGPFGYLDLSSIESLAKSKSPEEMFKSLIKLLPADFSSKISFEKEWSMKGLEFSLDLAAFEYLQKRSKEIGTQRVRLAWNFMTGIYEVENLVTMARLKYSEVPPDDIIRFLFPSRNKLDDADVRRLLETEDYSTFLRALRNTPYGEYIPNGEVDPMKVEDTLKKGLQRLKFEETQGDITAETIVRFFADVEARYDTIRKAVFFASIKGRNGG
jgi:vacuolar-type H+-ATPase subunit C/Vma6